MQLMGRQIDLDSAFGVGSIFWFTIPLGVVPAAAEGISPSQEP